MGDQEEKRNQGVASANNSVNSTDGNSLKLSHFYAFLENLSSSTYLRWLMIIFLPLLILLKYQVDRVDCDLWWHMAHGKYYLTHHILKMDLSIFSWTPTDPTWIYNTCLGSIAVYLFYNFMGGFGLWLMQWLIFGGIFLSFYLFLRLFNQRLDINNATIIATIAIGCFTACRFYKPELFSALLFSWTVFIFFYIKINRTKYLFYLYPLIFALWANLHGAFVVGLTFLILAFAGETLNRIFFSRESLTTRELFHFVGTGILSGAATLLNPYGIDYLISLSPAIKSAIGFKSYSGEYEWLIDNFALAYESLWPYLRTVRLESFDNGLTAWILTILMISVLILSAFDLIRKRSCDFAVLIISLSLYWKGMETSRSSYFFPIAFFFVFFYLLIYRLKFKSIPVRATVFSLLFFFVLFISISWLTIRYGADNKWFGAGIDSYSPVKEVAFLKKSRLEGPIFNDYGTGGYLTWNLYPEYKVFIDPRAALYRNQVLPDYIVFTTKHVNAEDIRLVREKYPFKIAIIHYRQLELIFDFLNSGDEWRLLYFEKNAAILVHKSLFPSIRWESINANLSPLRFMQEKIRKSWPMFLIFTFFLVRKRDATFIIFLKIMSAITICRRLNFCKRWILKSITGKNFRISPNEAFNRIIKALLFLILLFKNKALEEINSLISSQIQEGKIMIQNKIVAHYNNGNLFKGTCNDFVPNKDYFHMNLRGAQPGSRPLKLKTTGLKALFFVKKYDGNPKYNERKEFNPARFLTGRKIKALFKDGELMVGTTNGYQPAREGFFLVPADENSNNILCFVMTSATREVSFI